MTQIKLLLRQATYMSLCESARKDKIPVALKAIELIEDGIADETDEQWEYDDMAHSSLVDTLDWRSTVTF